MKCTTLYFLAIVVIVLSFPIAGISQWPPPPGTQQVSEGIFLDNSLVNNLDVVEYLMYYQRQHKDQFETLVSTPALQEIMENFEYSHELHDKPALGLSLLDIDRYCQWRSMVVNELKSNPSIASCSQKLIKKWQKVDPNHEYEVVYFLSIYPITKGSSSSTIHSDWSQVMGVESNAESSGDMIEIHKEGFRCVAVYRRK